MELSPGDIAVVITAIATLLAAINSMRKENIQNEINREKAHADGQKAEAERRKTDAETSASIQNIYQELLVDMKKDIECLKEESKFLKEELNKTNENAAKFHYRVSEVLDVLMKSIVTEGESKQIRANGDVIKAIEALKRDFDL